MPGRKSAAISLFCALATLATPPLLAQTQPHLAVDQMAAGTGSTAVVEVRLDSPDDIVSGFSFSLCSDPSVVMATSISNGLDLTPGYFHEVIYDDGITVGAVMGFHAGGETIPPGVDLAIVEIEYSITGEEGDSTGLEFCLLGSPQVETVVVIGGAAITPTISAGLIEVQTPFARGDCNGDSVVNLADPIFVEQYLFSGGDAPPCLKACDANDDGLVNIADSITTLTFLFAGGGPLPEPFPSCGTDPTEDDVSCENIEVCAEL